LCPGARRGGCSVEVRRHPSAARAPIDDAQHRRTRPAPFVPFLSSPYSWAHCLTMRYRERGTLQRV
jgi:hypothetical protein